jgi:hypothetical protein
MPVRKSTVWFALFVPCLVFFLLMGIIHPLAMDEQLRVRVEESKLLVRELGLTDLSLFMEASYTRHLSLADLHTPFQDHPTSLEHFPSGSTVLPPPIFRSQ